MVADLMSSAFDLYISCFHYFLRILFSFSSIVTLSSTMLGHLFWGRSRYNDFAHYISFTLGCFMIQKRIRLLRLRPHGLSAF